MDTTINQEDSPKLPQLQKGQSTYKLIVPADVEKKIRYLIRKFPSTEWSGVLFFTHRGTFEDNDLTITCRDIYPMDLGTSGWTEFRMSEDVAAYMADNIGLFDCETGLVHSHHSMGAFFSSQDNKMLQQEGNDTNCFVSLVVDTKGTYVARITRKVQSKSEVTVKSLGTSYEFFGEGTKELAKSDSTITKTVDREVIEYFDLEVERHEVPNEFEFLDIRFNEIEKRKKAAARTPDDRLSSKVIPSDRSFFDWIHKDDYKGKDPVPQVLVNSDAIVHSDDVWTPDPKKIHEAVIHIVTLNLILNPKDFNLKHWVTRHMTNVYKRVLGPYDPTESGRSAFTEWKDFIIQFTLDYFDDSDAPDDIVVNGDLFVSIIAQALIDELSEFTDVNPYIQEYIDTLSLYIIE